MLTWEELPEDQTRVDTPHPRGEDIEEDPDPTLTPETVPGQSARPDPEPDEPLENVELRYNQPPGLLDTIIDAMLAQSMSENYEIEAGLHGSYLTTPQND